MRQVATTRFACPDPDFAAPPARRPRRKNCVDSLVLPDSPSLASEKRAPKSALRTESIASRGATSAIGVPFEVTQPNSARQSKTTVLTRGRSTGLHPCKLLNALLLAVAPLTTSNGESRTLAHACARHQLPADEGLINGNDVICAAHDAQYAAKQRPFRATREILAARDILVAKARTAAYSRDRRRFLGGSDCGAAPGTRVCSAWICCLELLGSPPCGVLPAASDLARSSVKSVNVANRPSCERTTLRPSI